MKSFKFLVFFFFLIFSQIINAQKLPEINDLAWLTGNWEYTSPGGTRIIEYWTEPAGIMLGIGRTLKNGQIRSFEHLRIARKDSSIYYFAKPSGAKEETPFKLTKLNQKQAVFENPEHDFPQRIVYEKISEKEILVKVSGANGKGFSYKMSK